MYATSRTALATALLLIAAAPASHAQQRPDATTTPTPTPTIAAKTAGMQRIDGFMPLYWSERDGKRRRDFSDAIV